MKYRVDITLEGYIEVDEDTEEEAMAHAEDGFSLSQFYCEDSEIGEVSLVEVNDEL